MMTPIIKNDVMAAALMTFCRMYDQMEDMREEIKSNDKFFEAFLKEAKKLNAEESKENENG